MCHSNLFNDDFHGSRQDFICNVSITRWIASLPEEDYQSVIKMLPTTMKLRDPLVNIVAHGTLTPKVCRSNHNPCGSPQSWQSTIMAVRNHGNPQSWQSTIMAVHNHGSPGCKPNITLSLISIALLCSKYGIAELLLRAVHIPCVEFCVANACQ